MDSLSVYFNNFSGDNTTLNRIRGQRNIYRERVPYRVYGIFKYNSNYRVFGFFRKPMHLPYVILYYTLSANS